ncbi:chromate transporter [Bacillus sp. B-jedd]|uniref:chromate transporter n=1 Tax=Bacillus sp. B-jedd TaxID=1476857 RepID=UPI0005157235|nr:chromate transporter [Bacillus sp. B-jedd]CEG29404.1 chromate transporter [Bacillus sp. B-jedd]
MNSREKIRLLWGIFFTFLKVSPLSFGGGYAFIPLLERVVTEKKNWVKKDEITDMLIMAQMVPGSIAVNTATFIGYRLVGLPGAVAGVLGIVTPTFIIIIILATLFLNFQHNPIVEAAFMGIRPVIVALICYAAISIGRNAIFNKMTMFICLLSILSLLYLPVHPIFILIAGGITGILLNINLGGLGRKYSKGA